MTFAVFLRACVVWSMILCLAIANGALREAVLTPQLGNPRALILSGVLLSLCVLAAAWLFVAWTESLPAFNYLALGVMWLVMTLLFEFGFGLLRHKSWEDMLAAYEFQNGNLWPVVLLIIMLSPWVAAICQKRALP